MNFGGIKIKLIPFDSTTRKELMEPCCNTHLVQRLKHWLLPSYVCWQHWMINFDIGNDWDRQWLIWTMDIEDMAWFGQWTLKNMLNVGDPYTRISTLVPDTYLDTYPEFLIEQWFEVPIPDSNCYCSNIELRYLVYYYYSAPRQWVIAIVYCTKQ